MNSKLIQKKIGVYDSGLGGLFVLRELIRFFPGNEYTYLADEKNFPYGPKTIDELLILARRCIVYLFEEKQCDVVLLACNTLSSTVFDTLKKELEDIYKDKILLDIITPTIVSLPKDDQYAIFGTHRTVASHVYKEKIEAMFPNSNVTEIEAPDLARLIENKENAHAYLTSLRKYAPEHPFVCVLTCTHYGIEKDAFEIIFSPKNIISQEKSIISYMQQFISPLNIETKITILTTQKTKVFQEYSIEWFNLSTQEIAV